MAKLSQFKQDTRAINEGEWVRLEEFGDLEIFTRGWNDDYADAQARRQRQAAIGFGGNVDKLPAAVRRRINVDCLIQHVVRDVRNLMHDDGRPVTFPEFCDFLRSPDFPDLVLACFTAAGQVGARRAFDIEEATTPLSLSSATSSSGAAIHS